MGASISEGVHMVQSIDSLDNSVPEEISDEHIVLDAEEDSHDEPQVFGSVDELLVFSGASEPRGKGSQNPSRASSRPSSQLMQRLRPTSCKSIPNPASLAPMVSG